MASSPETRSPLFAVVLAAGVSALVYGCNPGAGAGQVTGTLTATDCGYVNEPYALDPDFFIAEGLLDGLHIRIQRGSDLPLRSDGLWIDVLSSDAIRLGRPVPVATGSRDDAVKVSMYFNETCPVRRHEAPVLLQGIGGTVTFTQIYDPGVEDAPNIVGTLDAIELVDPATPTTRRAIMSGNFDFVFNRGRPAQRYP